MDELTPTQSKVLALVAREAAAGRPCPSQLKIAAHCRFANSHVAGWYVHRLVGHGALVRDAG